MADHATHLRAGRIIREAVEQFETPTSSLIFEQIDGFGVRHYRMKNERQTLCDLTIHRGDPGYSSTCNACSRLLKRIRQARSAEGQRRAELRRANDIDDVRRDARINRLRAQVLDELRLLTPQEVAEFFRDVRDELGTTA